MGPLDTTIAPIRQREWEKLDSKFRNLENVSLRFNNFSKSDKALALRHLIADASVLAEDSFFHKLINCVKGESSQKRFIESVVICHVLSHAKDKDDAATTLLAQQTLHLLDNCPMDTFNAVCVVTDKRALVFAVPAGNDRTLTFGKDLIVNIQAGNDLVDQRVQALASQYATEYRRLDVERFENEGELDPRRNIFPALERMTASQLAHACQQLRYGAIDRATHFHVNNFWLQPGDVALVIQRVRESEAYRQDVEAGRTQWRDNVAHVSDWLRKHGYASDTSST